MVIPNTDTLMETRQVR